MTKNQVIFYPAYRHPAFQPRALNLPLWSDTARRHYPVDPAAVATRVYRALVPSRRRIAQNCFRLINSNITDNDPHFIWAQGDNIIKISPDGAGWDHERAEIITIQFWQGLWENAGLNFKRNLQLFFQPLFLYNVLLSSFQLLIGFGQLSILIL